MPRAYAHPDALCPIGWLEEHLYDPRVRILDASFHLPGAGRDAFADYAEGHIPGALRFDVDDVADTASPLPHMLPSAEIFAAKAGALGIGNETRVIVYDQPGSCAAARAWWTFRTFGHADVAVLDGGLAVWLAAGLPVTDAAAAVPAQTFAARFDPSRVRSAAEVLAALGDPAVRPVGQPAVQIVDNRPAGRWAGDDPEPRAARKRGHLPGAISLPFLAFVDAARHGAWRSADELAAVFERAGIDAERPVVAYCGSGVTACTTAFAACLLGREGVAVYDGSWAEWGNRDDTPVER